MELTTSFKQTIPQHLVKRYRWLEVRNATSILAAVAPRALDDVTTILSEFQLTAEHLLVAGGSKSDLARLIDERFRIRGWRETHLQLNVDGTLTRQPWASDRSRRRRPPPEVTQIHFRGETHKVDNYKDRVAIEVEWNAKDGNLDRDLSAFRALYEAGVIDAAVVITRHHASVKHLANSLAHALGRVRHKDGKELVRFGTTTTTNIEKLTWRLSRGDAGGCPVVAIGISRDTYTAGLELSVSNGRTLVQPEVPPLEEHVERALEREAAVREAQDKDVGDN